MELFDRWLMIRILIIVMECITEGAGASKELRIGSEAAIFAPPISFLCSISFALHPCRLYLLSTNNEAYGSAKCGADQGRYRSQPEIEGHTSKIRQLPEGGLV